MITPMDLQNKKFTTSPIGYKKSEVDEFFAEFLKDYDELYKGLRESKDKVKQLSESLQSHKDMEETMKKTLVVAETTAEQVRESARRDAESILAEANVKANEIISKANAKLDLLKSEFEQIKEQMKMYIIKSKAEIQVQLASLETTEEKVEKKNI